jgi:hypothetical protein
MQSSTKLEMVCPWLAQLKPWNGQGTYKDHLVQHYALMAMNKGTIDHARYMTRQLEKEWDGLGILIAKRIKELKNGD